MKARQTTQDVIPFIGSYNLRVGKRYLMNVLSSNTEEAVYMGRNVAFGCVCCGESSGIIWGHFFGNRKEGQIIVIPEQDVGSDEKYRVTSDGGVLIREFTLNMPFRDILRANPQNHFYGHLSTRDVQEMIKEAGLDAKLNK